LINAIIRLISRVPGTARWVSLALVIGLLMYLVFRSYGLGPTIVLVVGVLLVALVVLIYRRLKKRRERQRGLAFGKALDDAQTGPSREEVRQAVSELQEKWRGAMKSLGERKVDIYQLPWYMLIGEPQSGKSTTLKYSGLRFPIGMEAISGGGGTRNCDWWFAEQGVILDTAGRFTFHDASRPDSAEWDTFLRLLAKHRPHCPINGVILVIPVDALLEIDQSELESRARNISNQLLLIQKTLMIQFPVYLMVTKCDKIFGFVQFFNKLTPDQQREMFGWSSPNEEATFHAADFTASFDMLVERIDAIRLKHFSKPTFIDDPDKTFTFLEELRSLREPLRRYLELIFEGSVYRDPLFFRGYYFSSGMQEGQPIVTAAKNMLSSSAILDRLEEVFQRSRAFFVRDFYTEKVFPEEGLVRRAATYAGKDKLVRRLVWAGNALMLILGLLFVWGMHRDLRGSLEVPVDAIDGTVSTLNNTEGTFFTGPEPRRAVYGSLRRLRTVLDEGSGGGFFAFFRGDQNAMTRPLDDTFAYLYLDRFLMGLFSEADKQLRQYALSAPPRPRDSAHELSVLTAALSELKHWKVAAKTNDIDDMDPLPSITPFLALCLDPTWNDELADLRGDQALGEELDDWFRAVYSSSSRDVQRFLISEMVDQTTGIFDGLHRRVVAFYENQPELAAYRDKIAMLEEMQEAYALVGNSSNDWQTHDEKMARLAELFDEEHRARMAAKDDYLDFLTVRNKTIDALGPEFTDMRPREDEGDAISSVLGAFSNPERERKKLDGGITFVNVLLKVKPEELPDPRAKRPPEEQGPLDYPVGLTDFWTRMLEPYMTRYRDVVDPYIDLPIPGETMERNLEELFRTGQRRVELLEEILDEEMLQHLTHIPDPTANRRFERSFNTFHDALVVREQETVDAVMGRILSGEDVALPSPPSRWRAYVNAFNQRAGRDFDGFLEGPSKIGRLFRDRYQRYIRDIWFNSAKPDEILARYSDSVRDRLEPFAAEIRRLNGIGSEELARNRGTYISDIRANRKLRDLADIDNVPAYLEPHRVSLEAWADGAVEAFIGRIRVADPCPDCPVRLEKLREALRETELGFPIEFRGRASLHSVETGVLEVRANLADPDKVDEVLSTVDLYRQISGLQGDYLRRLGLTKTIEAAIEWAEGVRRLRSGEIRFELLIQDVAGEAVKIADETTYAELRGAFVTERHILINTPRLTGISADPGAGDNRYELVFFNDDPTNNTEAVLRFQGSLDPFLAFALDGRRVPDNNRVVRPITVQLNVGRGAIGEMVLSFSAPLPEPPDWGRILEP